MQKTRFSHEAAHIILLHKLRDITRALGKTWNGMEWNGMEWIGMDWNGMEWNGKDWIGMEWNGMEFYSIMSS